MRTLSIDIETYSPVDLTKAGVYVYAQHPEFEILLFGYSFDNNPVKVIDLASGEKMPEEVITALQDPGVLKTAHNALFERTCIANYFKKWLPIEQWECSMVKAAMLGLPLALWAVGKVLRLPDQKMYEGKALIRYFCLPCKPTKTNGMRERNLPADAPEKWQLFKNYCKRDVEVEQAVRNKIKFFEIPEAEKKLYILDQQINDRGVLLDMDFVRNAIRMGDSVKERLIAEAVMLTGLVNANSAAQIKDWLSEEMDEDVDSLTKKAIPELMKRTNSAEVTRVLEIRQETSKTSVKKYSAMVEAVGSDGRARGLFQFYGANRTGRWAGRIIQLQNLPQNHLNDLDLARKLVKENDLELLEMLFGSVPDTLSQLIRTAIIPKPEHTFVVADFSAIEARVIAWLAGEQWRLDVFNSHGKIYEASASKMFKVPIEEVTKGSSLRQKGKVAELACIAEGQLVFTNEGLVPIQQITRQHLLWDGLQFVRHQGLIYKGIKNTITYDGLTATPDHLVWVEGEPEPVRFEYAAANDIYLLRYKNYRTKGVESPVNNGYAHVYDILNAGPNNRFTVSGVLVHNCGYGGGVGALTAMGALEMGLQENELQGIINNWRAANPRIVDLWKQTNDAAVKAIKTGEVVPFHFGMKFHTANNILYITLPSGRALAYLRPRMGKNRFGGDSILYEGMNQTSKQWEVQETWGGKLVENIVQAIARDCLAVAMLKLAGKGYNICMHVHDEIVIEEFKHKADLETVCALMGEPVSWAKGLPLRADGYVIDYYRKD